MTSLLRYIAFTLSIYILIIDVVTTAIPTGLNSVLNQEVINYDNAETNEVIIESESPINNRLKRSNIDYSTLTTYKTSLNSSDIRVDDYLPAGALYGKFCPLFRFIFFAVPLYFCPVEPTSPVIDDDTTGSGISNKFGEDDEIKLIRPLYFPNSPIDLTPAKPKHPLSRPPPPVNHGSGPATVSTTTVKTATFTTIPTEDGPVQNTPAIRGCAGAIKICCTPGSAKYDDQCFERNYCPGPFFDSPCSS